MKRLQLNLNLTSVVIVIAVGVLVPVMLSTAAGIVSLFLAHDAGGIVTGVLIISFTVTAAGCALIAVVLTSRKARLARMQADFLASVSHELRTPLSAIKLYAQTLQSGSLDADPQQRAEFIDTILRETERLNVMVDRVLTWRASSNRMITFKRVSTTVSGAAQDAVRRFQALLPPEDAVNLVTNTESTLEVYHDPSAINAVVLNLLTNAYKYTGANKRIALTVDDAADHVTITVSDNGCGMTKSQRRRIFKPFYRGVPREDRDPGGMGLGLAIARYLVRRHGGSIDVDSHPGKGSVFRVRLPAGGNAA